jgi:rhodanese-related sulfurtransferase
MRKIVLVVLLVLVVSLPAFAAPPKNIVSTEARDLLTKNSTVFLLDVRTPDEYRQARLRGAVLIPINELEKRIAEIPKNKPVLVYCAVGSRSNLVAGFLNGKGYREVYNMTDGIVGWYRNGFPIDR